MDGILTFCTADYFQHYIPMFVYTAPSTPHIYLRGEVDDIVKEGLECVSRPYYVTTNQYLDFPNLNSTTNALRFLNHYIDNVYITDVDFIFLNHEPDLLTYYKRKMEKWGECYWGARGPKKGKLKRIQGGCFFASQEWYKKTTKMRVKMMEKVRTGEIGKIREDDETMLWNICAGSGLKCPTKRGNKRKAKYKDIHLGDFKFKHRWTNMTKMSKKITTGNVLKWFRLQEDPKWQKIRKICEKDEKIAKIMANVDAYMDKRRQIFKEKKRARHQLDRAAVQTR